MSGDAFDVLARGGGPVPVDAVFAVASADEATSPLSGARAAFFLVELFEGAGETAPLGQMILGDMVTLRRERFEVALPIRRATMRFSGIRPAPVRLVHAPAEVMPLLARLRAGGEVRFREHAVRRGDRLRLVATIERAAGAAPSLDQRLSDLRLVVRGDLGPVFVDEVSPPG